MASGDQRAHALPNIDSSGLRVGVIQARWNQEIVARLSAGVDRALASVGITDTEPVSVPGCYEIPLAAKFLAESGTVNAIVCLGVVIRGETTHYEIVSEGAAQGIQRVQLDTGIPIAFGLLTVENKSQAMARSQEPSENHHNVGEEAVLAAIEMAHLADKWKP